jgi:choice-of-anchor B domain-containing protein
MTNPDSPVLAATYTTNFTHSHTVSIDTTRGILICNGTRNASGLATGMRILALQNPGLGAAPENPVEIAWWPGGPIPVNDNNYVHDSVPVGNRLYCASIYPGIERVLDFTNPATPTQIAAWNYPGGFTHNSWPDASGNFLYVTDEVKGQPLKVFDISNLAAPSLADAITSNPQAIIHNAHVKGAELYLSNYTEGIRVLDLSDPAHPAEFAYADSYAGPSGGYSGVWEVCPFFPSGTVIASDRNSGLYVYGVVRNYGILRATVTTGGFVVSGIEVHLTTQGDSLTTPADGVVQFAPSPGSHTVLAHAFGYDASATRTVSNGAPHFDLFTVPRPTGLFGRGARRGHACSDQRRG